MRRDDTVLAELPWLARKSIERDRPAIVVHLIDQLLVFRIIRRDDASPLRIGRKLKHYAVTRLLAILHVLLVRLPRSLHLILAQSVDDIILRPVADLLIDLGLELIHPLVISIIGRGLPIGLIVVLPDGFERRVGVTNLKVLIPCPIFCGLLITLAGIALAVAVSLSTLAVSLRANVSLEDLDGSLLCFLLCRLTQLLAHLISRLALRVTYPVVICNRRRFIVQALIHIIVGHHRKECGLRLRVTLCGLVRLDNRPLLLKPLAVDSCALIVLSRPSP